MKIDGFSELYLLGNLKKTKDLKLKINNLLEQINHEKLLIDLYSSNYKNHKGKGIKVKVGSDKQFNRK